MDRRISGGVVYDYCQALEERVSFCCLLYSIQRTQGGDELGHDPDRPCVEESEGILLISLIQVPWQGLVFRSNGLGFGLRHATHLQEGTDV